MKIIRTWDETTLAQFADRHNLTLNMGRRADSRLSRYYCSFDGAEIMSNGMLVGAHGNGATEIDAMADYARQLSGQRIVIGAYKPTRHEIQVPFLIP